jgi:hypothetical protein
MALLRAAALAHPGFVRWGWMGIFLLVANSLKLSAQPAVSAEYQIKAVFLFNFARFVDWPAKAFPDADSPFVIGILGDDPFGSYLDETVRGERVNGHPLTVQRYRRLSEVKACQVLFISRSEADRLDQILASLRGRSILTVGDTDDFVAHGGMIRLATEKNKVRMHINLDAVKAANLAISSKLLRVAEVQH